VNGPKGIGKTSAARILAKIINCESKNPPCDKCEQCLSITHGTNLDVVELDAASHRGIDDVRTLRDAVKLAPTKAKKKIYIIDEAHMLTTEASNALLKTLEEPPEHVVFILATTNPEKLIDTIRSRTTLISFRKATPEEIVKSLKRVVAGEKIKITKESLFKIANISGGAFRDAIKILEQFALEGEEYLDRYKNSELGTFISFLVKKDEKLAILEIEKSVSAGASMEVFLQELLGTFHQAILAESGIGENKLEGLDKKDLIKLSELFTEANKNLVDSPIEELPVEIAVIKWCEGQVKSEEDSEVRNTAVPPEKKVETAPAQDLKESTQESVGIVNDDIWKKILSEVHPVNVSIEGLLRASRPVGYDGHTLTLGVFYKFHKERLEDVNHRKILEEVIEKVLDSPTKVICTLIEPPPKKIIEEAKTESVLTESRDNDIIKAAEEIFGSQE
jgi:DNA polymerase-3 subunit gamma/tau